MIINADSSQVYADLTILSARPTPDEMGGIPHRLFGEWDGAHACSAADWAHAARRVVAEVHAEQAVPILVGGTGLYLRTLLDGIAPVPSIYDDVREAVRAMPLDAAYAALRGEDPERAARLAPADGTRIRRALEVVRSTGSTLSHWQAQTSGGIGDAVDVRAVILLPERQALYERCDRRFDRMIARGAMGEVEALLQRSLDPRLPVMRAIGVSELASVVCGDWDMAEAIAKGAQATRNYAKRQFTWLRHQPPATWPRIQFENYNSKTFDDILFRFVG